MTSEMDRIERMLRNLEESRPAFRVGEMAFVGPGRKFRPLQESDDPREVIRVMDKDLGRHQGEQ